MARRPGPALPDVFARPGAAPARGTPIEDLPQDAAPPEPVAEPPPPPPPAIEPQPVRYQTARRPGCRAPEVAPSPLAIVALVISLTAPFWADYLLPIIGIRTTRSRASPNRTRWPWTRQQARSEDVSLEACRPVGADHVAADRARQRDPPDRADRRDDPHDGAGAAERNRFHAAQCRSAPNWRWCAPAAPILAM